MTWDRIPILSSKKPAATTAGFLFCAFCCSKSRMKIVILGAAGQLGRQLARVLPDAVSLKHEDADLTKPDHLRQTLAQLRPWVVVNAAGYTHVDRAETNADGAFAVNAHGVRDLAVICRELDSPLIHISTNYVFGADDLRTTPYRESDVPGPISVYGASKLLGECHVQAMCPKHFILRTCGLYGPGGQRSNFVEAMLRQAEKGAAIRVVDDQVCTPTSAFDLAYAVRGLVDSETYGLYHVTNSSACSWHEFARSIFEMTKRRVELVAIASSAYPALARRPRYSVLDNSRWIGAGFTPLRSWQEALAQYLAERVS
ncbi:MAG: dTDP-4-dehydrorhamnose reductase [Gemmataceae bacterium]|nr:dTDP-4-dehydrorhamnose reductase [Gemmataceae bacterium]